MGTALPFDYRGPEVLGTRVLEALTAVVDPEIAIDIVNLGLVYEVAITQTSARVKMTMTSAACPVTDMLVDEVKTQLADILGDGQPVEVQLVWEPSWTPDRLSPSARRFMGW